MKGVPQTNIDWVNKGTETLGGNFTVQVNGETLEIEYDE